MTSLLNISTLNYEDVLSHYKSADKNELISTLKDCFLYAPHKVDLICQLLINICQSDSSLILIITELLTTPSPSIQSNISLLIYSKTLNFNIPSINSKVIENEIFKNKENDILKDRELEINEYLNNLECFLEEIKSKLHFNVKIDELEFFKIIFIIKNYQFDIYECLDELTKYSTNDIDYLAILYLINNEELDSFYLINLFLRSIHDKENVNTLLKIFPMMNKQIRDRLIAFIFEYFINRKFFRHSPDTKNFFDSEEEISELKKFIDEDTVREMKKFVSIQNLESFLPDFKNIYEVKKINPVKKEDFNVNQDKEGFYRDFCLLGSPSISHFLSYLEIYKEEMRMTEEDQKIFLDIFNEIFENRTSFKRIVLEKMSKFKFIN
ncbi:uncharacterized protein VNE69_02040 [Vairimorpha necatrix]|uniref:Uncharacterized protein n=1 Tax=Vairimorpha necatrix TaxID=6039 RepID=A0AAX4J9B7_9MICR